MAFQFENTPFGLKLSFVIPLYNCLPFTQAMLASLRATLPPGLAHEIIFVDDGSTDGTREWLATLTDPPFRVLLNEKNLGYAAANNRGAALAQGEFIALLNNDLVLTPRWLEPILAVHARLGARAGLVGNVQLNASTGELDHTGVFIDHKGKPQHDRTPSSSFHRFIQNWRTVNLVTGACMVIRRELWSQLGGFDLRYINGCEDVDLCLRAKAAGHANAVAFRSVVLHHISTSAGRNLRNEENCYRLTLRWRDELARMGWPAWCRLFLKQDWNAATEFSVCTSAMAALAYVLHLRRTPPSVAIAGMQAAVAFELARWEKMFGPELPGNAPHPAN
jgi:O-antigen biosynthesis protein